MNEKSINLNIPRKLFIAFICICINLIGKFVTMSLYLPLWLDTVGTCVAAYFTGPVGAVIVGVASNLFFGLIDGIAVSYCATSAALALIYWFCVKKGYFDSFKFAMMCALPIGVASIIISVPVNLIISDGLCGNMWGDALFERLEIGGTPKFLCAIWAESLIDIIDKTISIFLGLLIIRMLLKLFKIKREPKNKTLPLSVALITAVTAVSCFNINANADYTNFISTIYNSGNGLISSEANTIEQTDDGYIWIGSYAGLSRYDGRNFEFIREGGITGVNALLTDSKGRLWIGTNDRGVAVYDDKSWKFIDRTNGLLANSIRSFAELPDGSIYVGTTGNIYRIGTDDIITEIAPQFNYVISMSVSDDTVFGVTHYGSLFALNKDGTAKSIDTGDGYYTCVLVVDDIIYAGTLTGKVEMFRYEDNEFKSIYEHQAGSLTAISSLYYDESVRLWVSAGNGYGYFNDNGIFYEKSITGFDSSLGPAIEDYQHNIWLTSSRYGVVKLSKNDFTDLLASANSEPQVVNTICEYGSYFYCGTDNGLTVIDRKTRSLVENDITEFFKDVRIRCIKADSKGNIWFCTYSDNGLVRFTPDETRISGSMTCFTEPDTTSNRFRCVIELPDGSIAAGTADGLNIIEGDSVKHRITNDDGLLNSQILCMSLTEKGDILAGSDGAGIFIISPEGKVVNHISMANGLTSEIILRITPFQKGYFVVTSNSLCYMENGEVNNIDKFPYYNNYDVIIDNNTAYITSSSGVYAADAVLLARGEIPNYKHFGYNDGLIQGLTANSWNCIDNDGSILLCTNVGVYEYNHDYSHSKRDKYKMCISSVVGNSDEIIFRDGEYFVPKDTTLLSIEASLMNYTIDDVPVRFYIREINNNPKTILASELLPLRVANLSYGTYTVCLQVLDDSGKIIQEELAILNKEPHTWELPWFTFYLNIAYIAIGALIVWSVLMYFIQFKKHKEFEDIRHRAKSEFLANMSHEIRTPVNVVIGMNELILRENTDEKIRRYALDIKTASHSLLSLINDILDYSAVEAGKIVLNPEKYSLGKILNEMLLMVRQRAEIKGIEIISDIDGELPGELIGDEIRIKQVILNLLTNAVKYTDKGSVTLTVKGTVQYESTCLLNIEVKDTGVGIRDEDLKKLFGSFERLEHYKNMDIEGTGLGLNITRKLVDIMGGTISVQSVYGSGSTFTVTIPQEISSDEKLGSIEDHAITYDESEKTHQYLIAPDAKVLVVDDNEMNLRAAKGLLERTRIQVDAVSDGNSCIKFCKEKRYTLIFMDHMMPPPDGIETLHMLRDDEESRNRNTPVVMLTANAISGMKEMYMKEGFSDYLSKPIDVDEMDKILLKYIPEELMTMVDGKESSNNEEVKPDSSEKYSCIDVKLGMRYCMNSMDIYKEILGSYYNQTCDYREKLLKLYEEKNWHDYAIMVHALKSSSLNIGALELSNLAKAQEMAAKSKTQIIDNNSIEQLLEVVDEVLKEAKNIIDN